MYKETGAEVYQINIPGIESAHVKLAIIDPDTEDASALLGTTNFDKPREGLGDERPPSRDYALRINNLSVVKELQRGFLAAINGTPIKGTHPSIIWGPDAGNLRKKIIEFIDSAEKSILIEEQSIQDVEIAKHLADKAAEGVIVEIVNSTNLFGNRHGNVNKKSQEMIINAGGKVFFNDKFNIHAKIIIIDHETKQPRMYLGSLNLYGRDLDSVLNVGALVRYPPLIQQVLGYIELDKSDSKRMKKVEAEVI